MKLSSFSIRAHLLALISMMMIVPVGLIIYSSLNQREYQKQQTRFQTARLARQVGADLSGFTASTEILLRTLSKLKIVQDRNVPAVTDLLAEIIKQNPIYVNITMLDRDGYLWASAFPVKERLCYAERRHFKNAVATGNFSSSEYYIGKQVRRPMLAFALPMKNETGEITGVDITAFDLHHLEKVLGAMALPKGMTVTLVDHKGTIIYNASSAGLAGTPDDPALFQRMVQGAEEGTFETAGSAPEIVSYQKLRLRTEATPYLYVRGAIKADLALAETNRALVVNVLVLSSLMLVMFALATYTTKRYLVDKIDVLLDASRRLAQGDLEVHVAGRVAGGELGELGAAFDNMAGNLSRDIRERRQVEHTLRHSQRMLLEAQRVARLGTYVYDIPAGTWEGSEVLDSIFGLDGPGPRTVSSWLALIHPDDRQMMNQHLVEVLAQKSPFNKEYRILRLRDGETRWVRGLGGLDLDPAGKPVRMIGTIQDITESKLLEDELKLKSFTIQKITEAVYLITEDARIWGVNEAACKALGYTEAELLAMSITDIDPDFPREQIRQNWQLTKERGSIRFESSHTDKNGRKFPVEITVTHCMYGDIEYNCAIVHDISSRKEAEAEKQELMLQLGQAQKMESIGRLAGGIAHDFNNLLTPILGYAELLQYGMPQESAARKRVDAILQAADKARVLTQQLLSFGRKQHLDMKVVDMNDAIESFHDILRRTIREDIEIRTDLTPDRLGIWADQNQLQQIIMNLVVNAQDAIEGKGTISIETLPVTLDEEYTRLHAEVTPGRYLMLAVSDSGKGMNQETLSHIFEPFFTTKGVGEGSGLGLATVYGLVKQHGGHVWVSSEPAKGTVFRLYFPLVEDKPALVAASGAVQQPSLQPGDRTILLVEDNEMVKGLVHDLLLGYGFKVVVAERPSLALRACQGRRIDLVVTDVVMPEMNGPELYQRLLADRPDLKVLFMSGYTNNVIAQHSLLDEGTNFIQKPFTVTDLAHKINLILGAGAAG